MRGLLVVVQANVQGAEAHLHYLHVKYDSVSVEEPEAEPGVKDQKYRQE
jgi:hypothetical protein